jgi:hypothetical protein
MYNTLIFSIAGFTSGIILGAGIIIVSRTLSKKKAPEVETYRTTFSFSGNLKQTPLLEAIQFLELGRREGILHIYCGRRKGYLIFKRGQVVDAFYRNETGKDAVFTMLSLEEGDFYFEVETVAQPRIINETVMDLVFEWDAKKNANSQ